jgi:hypothetical protein
VRAGGGTIRCVIWPVALTLAAGAAAGGLGALLGIGGGVLLVPLLHLALGLPFSHAAAVSLVGVLATSGSMSTTPAARRLLNARLALVLLVFSVSGAVVGAHTVHLVPVRALELIFGGTAALVAVVMFGRANQRNVLDGTLPDLGALGGRFHDDDTARTVAYRVRRLPLALGVSAAAGLLASYVGIGGGIVIVPALNAWCGVPMRVAASTSAFMIGVTAVPGVIGYYASGTLGDFRLAGAAVLGVLGGYRLGSRVSGSAPVRRLKILMAIVLAAVAAMYLR